jgi:hypothetical protein
LFSSSFQDKLLGLEGDAQLRYLDHVIAEQLRLFPLFGVAHRITSSDIELPDKTTVRCGTVLFVGSMEKRK